VAAAGIGGDGEEERCRRGWGEEAAMRVGEDAAAWVGAAGGGASRDRERRFFPTRGARGWVWLGGDGAHGWK
jgi:hypothetical protein